MIFVIYQEKDREKEREWRERALICEGLEAQFSRLDTFSDMRLFSKDLQIID